MLQEAKVSHLHDRLPSWHRLQQSPHSAWTGLQAGRGCKKLGRPITWDGDPEDPNLPESDRKKIRRRVKNRESARRVQQRRKAAA